MKREQDEESARDENAREARSREREREGEGEGEGEREREPSSAGMSPAFRRGTEPTDKGIGVHRHLLHHRRDSKLGQVSCCRGGVRALARPSMARRAREDVCEAVDVPGMARRVWSGRAGGEWCVMKERLRDVSHARFACAALLSRGRWPRREPRAAERTAPSARAPCRSRPAPAPRWSCSCPARASPRASSHRRKESL